MMLPTTQTLLLKVIVIGLGVLIFSLATLLVWGLFIKKSAPPLSYDEIPIVTLEKGEQLREFKMQDGDIFIRTEKKDGSHSIRTFRNKELTTILTIRSSQE